MRTTTLEARGGDEDEAVGTLVSWALAAVAGGLLWVVFVLAVRWVLELPPPALARLAAVALLFAGSGLVFFALVQLELCVRPSPDLNRGRRPTCAASRELSAPAGPPRARVASTAPPQAGGRALHMVERGR